MATLWQEFVEYVSDCSARVLTVCRQLRQLHVAVMLTADLRGKV